MADLLRPLGDGILVWDELLATIGHEVSQDTLSCLLEKSELDDIPFGSTVFGKMLGLNVNFVC